jgi:hypothetical protein
MGSEHMCVGFIFWDVEINNDFEVIALATRIALAAGYAFVRGRSRSGGYF